MLKKEESKELQALSKALNTIGRKDASKKVASLLKVASFDLSQIKSWVRDQSRKVYKTHMNKDSKDTPTYSARRWFNFNGGQLGLRVKCFGNAGKIVTLYKLNEWWLDYSVSDQKTFDEDTKQVDSLDEAAKEDIKSLLTELAALDEEINGTTSSPPGLSSAPASSAGEPGGGGDLAVSSERAFKTQAEADAVLAKLNASGKLQEGQSSPDQPLLLNYLRDYAIDKVVYISDGNTAFRFNSEGTCVYQERGKDQVAVSFPNSLRMFNIVFETVFELARYRGREVPFQIKIKGFRPQDGVQSLNISTQAAEAKDSLFASSSLRKRRLMKFADQDFEIPPDVWEALDKGELNQPEAAPSQARRRGPGPWAGVQDLIREKAALLNANITEQNVGKALTDGLWGRRTSEAYNIVMKAADRLNDANTTSTSAGDNPQGLAAKLRSITAPSEASSQADAPLDEARKELLKKYWLAKPSDDKKRLFTNRDKLTDDFWTYVRENKETIDTVLSDDQYKARAQKLSEAFDKDNGGGLLYLYLRRSAESEDATDEFASSDFIMAAGEKDFHDKMRVFINKKKDSRLYKELFYDLSDGNIEFLSKRDADPRSGDDRWGDSLTNEEKRNLERAIKESRLEEDVQRALLDSIKDYRRVQRRRRKKSRRFRDR